MTTGVIFDSGGVLLRPISGQWFPPPGFAEVTAARGLAWTEEQLTPALAAGMEFLDAEHTIPLASEEEEHELWTRYFDVVLRALEHHGDSLPALITERWKASRCVELFEWTMPVLTELRARDIPVVVLSDAWPSLRRWYGELGLDGFVDAMVISAEEGITKPDRRVFEKARSLLGGVDDVVFVDDWPYNVRAANELAMRGLRLRPVGAESDPSVLEIQDLRVVLDHLEA